MSSALWASTETKKRGRPMWIPNTALLRSEHVRKFTYLRNIGRTWLFGGQAEAHEA